ncbi:GTP-binding protein Era [Marinospirillum celere]|uniref:GTPase Era n=1 Tax=Marinospirillum celere TaxID=1122252 RepID=A0A1I1FUR7_9GAMM|nr:GTPase Era [Marinospirillum celere]SFC02766.1 GTP-binding protein Era [Marinospirillum celere]
MSVSRSGYIALVGRPNVGKSTLLNRILGQKISITCKKPQTTRHQILGIHTDQTTQAIFVDTPGMHLATGDRDRAINHYMNDAASRALKDVDLVIFLIDRTKWTDEDDLVLKRLQYVKCPVILAINKVDWLEDKASLLPYIEEVSQKFAFEQIIPISAKQGTQVDELITQATSRLPEGEHFFPEDQVTDRSSRFLASELVREKIMRQLGEELPYSTTVEIEKFQQQGHVLHIHALILVEREGQKKIIIGDKGSRIKQIGRDARLDMEQAFDTKVMLNLWVKVKSNWSDDARALKSLGYNDLN